MTSASSFLAAGLMPITSHPRFDPWRVALSNHPALATPWTGYAFRFASLRYLRPEEILSGEGSLRNGGRWNAPGSFPAVYGSLDKATSATELDARARYYGLTADMLQPAVLVAVELRLQRVLDLSAPPVLKALDVTSPELAATDWRAEQAAGREAFTQALGRAAFATGMEALLVPSALVPGAVNVVYLPRNRRPGSVAGIPNDAELRRLGGN